MNEISAADVAQFKASARSAFGVERGSEETRRLMATADGWDHEAWRRLARELDLPGLLLPSEYGGADMTTIELAYVLEESGAALYCSPLFATVALAVPLLLASGDQDALARYAPAIAAGDLTATVALAEDDGRWRLDAVTTTATPTDDGWQLDGAKNYVVDGATAGLLLVVARTPDGLGVFAVEPEAAGLGREQLVTLDQTRKMARVTLAATPATLVGTTDAAAAIDEASDVSRALLAAEQTGAAQRCLDVTAEYARTRIQFARPIGSFQAIKQRLAEMLIQVESSRSAAYVAARAAAQHDPELGEIARIAAITAGDALMYVSAQMIQLHGGIGFTWEHDAHLYYKRARTSALLLGTEGDHLKALATALDAAQD